MSWLFRWGRGDDTRAALSPSDALFFVGVLIVVLARFVILRSGGAPPTIDSGNWLAFADSMLGRGVRSSSIVYPPVVPLLTAAVVGLFGLVDGISLLGALASAAPALGVYVVLRYQGLELGALVPSLLVLGASSVGEATAWGGFPQLIGFGLAPVALAAVYRWQRSWSIRAAVVAGMLFAFIMAVSHFVALIVAVAIAAMSLVAVVTRIDARPDWRVAVKSIVVFAIPAVLLVPLYVSLGRAYLGPSEPLVTSGKFAWSELPDQLEFLYRAFPWLWRIVIPASVLAPVVFIARRGSLLWRTLTSLLVAVAGVTILMRDVRVLYFMTVVGGLGLALWLDGAVTIFRRKSEADADRRPRWFAVGSIAVLFCVCFWQLHVGLRFFETQRNHYGVLSPGLVAAIDHVRDHSATTEVVAVPALHDAPIGWWVEAIVDRKVIYGSPLGWLVFDAEIERASIANRIFAPRFPSEDGLQLASDAGVSYIVIPTAWTFYEPDLIAQLQGTSRWDVIFHNDDAVVLGAVASP